jgi:hypothetical protein
MHQELHRGRITVPEYRRAIDAIDGGIVASWARLRVSARGIIIHHCAWSSMYSHHYGVPYASRRDYARNHGASRARRITRDRV